MTGEESLWGSRFSDAVGSTLSVLASRLLTDLKEKRRKN